MRKWCAITVSVLLLSGCLPIYYSAKFEPSSSKGMEAFSRAKRDIYPRQVLENPDIFKKDSVAWVGIVKDTRLFQSRSGEAAMILLEHHYFDWIEDHGAQRELYFLSPRGEGDFGIVLGPGEFDKDVKTRIPNGTMVVAIGKTKVMGEGAGKQLYVLTEHHQFIDRKAYRMDLYDYGREGEPFKAVPESSLFKKPAMTPAIQPAPRP